MTYRPTFHLSPPQGRLNDPNGVTLIGDQLHVFYQHDPCFPHGAKRTGWGHAVTTIGGEEGLGQWRHLPDALYPDFLYDTHGCYSGSSVVHDGEVMLFYTGNVKEDGRRLTTQNLVRVEDLEGPMGGVYHRAPENPLIDGAALGFTAHYRDPHVTQNEDGSWRMVLGAQREEERGAVVLYESPDLLNWSFVGALQFEGLDPRVEAAYMWECPNLLRMRDHATGQWREVLVLCPQYPGSDECGYVVGTLDGLWFRVESQFRPLDFGHQFYAPQMVAEGDGDALLLGWMGLPARDDTPTLQAEGWVHQLTLPRRLQLVDGQLRTELLLPTDPAGMVVHREVLGGQPCEADLVDDAGGVGAHVAWRPGDAGRGTVSVTVGDDERSAECAQGELVVCADGAALEVVAGGGEVAFSSAVFGTEGAPWVAVEVREIGHNRG